MMLFIVLLLEASRKYMLIVEIENEKLLKRQVFA